VTRSGSASRSFRRFQRAARCLGIAFLSSCFASAVPAEVVQITLYHTNDMHGWIMPREVPPSSPAPQGGMAVLSAYLERDTAGWSGRPEDKPYLLLDGGDFFQGTPEGNLTRGEAVVECMNRLGYDAAALGNHEFDFGVEALSRLMGQARFPFLASNVRDGDGRLGALRPFLVKTVSGVNVGIFGLLTPETREMVVGKNIRGIEFEDERAAAQRCVRELRRRGAQVIVALTHCGWRGFSPEKGSGDAALARSVKGVDVIIGGHSHTPFPDPQWVGDTMVVQAGSRLGWVGKVRIDWDSASKKVSRMSYRLIPLRRDRWGEQAEMKAFVAEQRKKASAILGRDLDQVLGRAVTDITRNRSGESLMGNWQTDVMRRRTGAQIAFQNSGGIRDDFRKGPLLVRDVYYVSPFENTLVTMMLTGRQIRNILETSVSGRHGILQLSGMSMAYRPDSPVGQRVEEVVVGGYPLEESRAYQIVTNSFLASGGDGFDDFEKGVNTVDTKINLFDAECEAIRGASSVASRLEGRIRRIGEGEKAR